MQYLLYNRYMYAVHRRENMYADIKHVTLPVTSLVSWLVKKGHAGFEKFRQVPSRAAAYRTPASTAG